jgi:hypothetical protein
MTLPVRAYLMIRSPQGEWSVSVCRDLDAVLSIWRERFEPNQTVGVLHVGFDRAASALFNQIAANYPGRMVVTAAAKHAVPRGFESSERPIGEVEGQPVHLGTKGWGYVILEDPTEITLAPSSVSIRNPTPATSLQGWVREFLAAYTEMAEPFEASGIFDDVSFFSNEKELDRDIRYRAGLFRYRSLVRPHSDDPCEIVRASPPWFLDRPLNTIDLTVRVSNVFVNMHLSIVRDLLAYDSDRLLKIQNFGRKSVRVLHDALLQALNEGPYDIKEKIEEASLAKLMDEIERSLAAFDERERDILVRRMGLRAKAETLQEIGDDYDITRERIRQIEAKSLEKLARAAFWNDLLITKLEGMLLGREFPLPILGLEALDRWFDGIGKSPSALKYILSNICEGRVSVVRIEGIDYVGQIKQEEWQDAMREGRRILASSLGEDRSEEHCRMLVGNLIAETSREFRGLLWQKVSILCHFIVEEDGKRMLASYGRGADHVVEAVLLDAERPLHYTEIATRAAQRSGKTIDLRRIRNAAAATGILLGRGVYGLEHHIKLSDEDSVIIRDELEQAVVDGPDGRQWHNYELLALVSERDLPGAARMDKYLIDVVLRPSLLLQRLGRMTWAKSDISLTGSSNRIDIRQGIISLLQQSGRPLTSNEIRQRLIALRGVNEHFQISASDSIVRVGTGWWGLNDRDIPLKRAEQPAVIEHLINTLQLRNSGIHISEIAALTKEKNAHDVSPETLFSIAAQDARLQASSAQFLFLREWGDARRETISSAVVACLQQKSEGLSIEEIVARVQTRTQRPCDKRTISSCLQAIEAQFDPISERWSMSLSSADEGDEFQESDMPSNSLLAAIDWSAP